ncbi:hypothetical protein [Burkholderia vietnamiensis]|uniref:hypothetical protein n=1 Tax=Burkholderia vietnamiensis TaxID=60552 RepID=UPI001B9A7530|nr:hypothetical protein [Burkholderia vietnamiensis]MBR8005570.1 hypothetical protein [Burkholderia vietnamiensis]
MSYSENKAPGSDRAAKHDNLEEPFLKGHGIAQFDHARSLKRLVASVVGHGKRQPDFAAVSHGVGDDPKRPGGIGDGSMPVAGRAADRLVSDG